MESDGPEYFVCPGRTHSAHANKLNDFVLRPLQKKRKLKKILQGPESPTAKS